MLGHLAIALNPQFFRFNFRPLFSKWPKFRIFLKNGQISRKILYLFKFLCQIVNFRRYSALLAPKMVQLAISRHTQPFVADYSSALGVTKVRYLNLKLITMFSRFLDMKKKKKFGFFTVVQEGSYFRTIAQWTKRGTLKLA